MIGGLKKTTSRFAIAAAASVIATSAMAADLGGNCCADLEERIAELEATTARKGNRRVSLEVYGQVNEGILWWDDGDERNAYVVTNTNSRTRFGFRGNARISSEWSAGYLIEIGIGIADSNNVNQFIDDNTLARSSLDLRHSAWWIESNRLGRVWVGHTSMATDGIISINLAQTSTTLGTNVTNYGGGFLLRLDDGRLLVRNGLSGLTWNDILSPGQPPGDGSRRNLIRYISPTFWGFTFSSSWGEDDFWDVALRYANEFNGVRVAAGVGWQHWTDGNAVAFLPGVGLGDVGVFSTGSQNALGCADLDNAFAPALFSDSILERNFLLGVARRGEDVDCSAFGTSASVMHMPTGLYLSGAYGYLQDENRRLLVALRSEGLILDADDRDQFWYIQGGIEKNFFGIGASTIYAEYFNSDAGPGNFRDIGFLFPTAGDVNEHAFVRSSDVSVWGFGFVQQIDAAAMSLYASYRNFSGDADVRFRHDFFEGTGEDRRLVRKRIRDRNLDFDDLHVLFTGAIIRF